ncbi:hypothetical protein B0T26DRAFT_716733 [Lasiosphaeria miniovina]|uniref:Uncharacterized protein n=1 Tax=Lasiosphaeria miniovina TaxID=1954250 RepID=A0AA40ACD5_9PEZI|nr:uncharacterized protein B0T26DRAFT_716733 [Lasiosphaeria miniovina]KAK0713192.1 hypothetical protein B0T26DRAFT_716733 [Lasiosphaeria miniovina]
MTAIECSAVWGAMTIFPKQVIPCAIDAFVAFTEGVCADPASSLVCVFTHMPDFKEIFVATLYANVDGIEKPPAYDGWRALLEMFNSVKMTSVSDMAFEYNTLTNHQ